MFADAELIAWSVVLVAAFVAGLIDIWQLRVPNWLTLPLMASGLLFHALHQGFEGFLMSFGGLLLGGLLLFVLFAMGGMGAGDVKMLAAMGAWIGARDVFVVFLVASLVAGACSLILSVWAGRLRQVLTEVSCTVTQGWILLHHLGGDDRIEQVVSQEDRRIRVIPFATMLFVGALLVVWLAL